MNERIQKFAEQAGFSFRVDDACDDEIVRIYKTADKVEKLAELIVKECAEICRRQQYYDADDEYKRGVNGGSFTCMNAIKREFGVEE